MLSQEETGQWDGRVLRVGELARLLDRKWWRCVWDVVLDESVILVCGLDNVLWEVFKAVSRDKIQVVKCIKVGMLLSITVLIPIAFPCEFCQEHGNVMNGSKRSSIML